jgi:hypothetical protein
MKVKRSLQQKLFILCNELKKQFAKLIREQSTLVACIAKFILLREPIRIIFFIADQLSHIIKNLCLRVLISLKAIS